MIGSKREKRRQRRKEAGKQRRMSPADRDKLKTKNNLKGVRP